MALPRFPPTIRSSWNAGYRVTISGGVATYPHDAGDAAALLEEADRRLYRAKEGGRNRVVVA